MLRDTIKQDIIQFLEHCESKSYACSKSTIKTLELGVKYVQANNRNTTITSLAPFHCFCC